MHLWISLLFILLVGPQAALGKETDNLTGRYKFLADSTDVLDNEMNRRLEELEKKVQNLDCKTGADPGRELRIKFHDLNGSSNFIGTMETWAEDKSQVAKRSVDIKSSIYKDVLSNGIIFNRVKLASTIKVNGQLIGTDKLGHFIDEGFSFYTPFRQKGRDLSAALSGSLGSESGYSGGESTGSKAFADSMANYQGILFYDRLTEGDSSYFRCEQGHWKKVRRFSFAEYVDAGWDEGLNCSEITVNQEQYKKNIKALEDEAKKFGRDERYQCPVDPDACVALRRRYTSDVKKYVISPVCLKTRGSSGAPGTGTGGTPSGGAGGVR